MKKYWLVKPEYYNQINNLLNTDFNEKTINNFKIKYQKGVYVLIYIKDNGDVIYSHMPYPIFKDSNTNNTFSSSVWLENRDFVYSGEISRKSKLNKINKLS